MPTPNLSANVSDMTGSSSYDHALDDYVPVEERIRQFRDKHPEGSLQAANPDAPYELTQVADQAFIVYTAAAYRSPDDPRPGIGVAWEPVPGRTPFTRNSELMNAETSAWGRALIAVGAADAKASQEEVRNRRAEQAHPRAAAKIAVVAAADGDKAIAADVWRLLGLDSQGDTVPDRQLNEAIGAAKVLAAAEAPAAVPAPLVEDTEEF